MVKFKGISTNGVLAEAMHDFIDYLQYELMLDIEYTLLYIITPIVVAGFTFYGSLGFLGEIYRWFVPPSAEALHRSALAALHHRKRVVKDNTVHYKAAEKLFLASIAKDDLYFPAYLSLASLYIYRMKLPDKALAILDTAKDRGSLKQIEPLRSDAEALQAGNEHMIQAGGAIFAEQDYLSITERYDKFT